MTLTQHRQLILLSGLALTLLIGCSEKQPETVNEKPPEPAPCKVDDPDIATTYSGSCIDGLADGNGVARGRDVYDGEFRAGKAHGPGVYAWGNLSDWANHRYEGSHFRGERTGFGAYSVPNDPNTTGFEFYQKHGSLETDRYVVRGLWIAGELVDSCASEDKCMQSMGFERFKALRSTIPDKDFAITAKRVARTFEDSLAFLESDSISENTVRCIVHEVIREAVADSPSAGVLTRQEMLKMVDVLSNGSLTFGFFGDCVLRDRNGKLPTEGDDDPYQELSLDELRVDFGNLGPDMVKVSGKGGYTGNAVYLGKDQTDPNFILIDVEKIPREQMLELFRDCGKGLFSGCHLIIYGTVGSVLFVQKGLVADKIEISH